MKERCCDEVIAATTTIDTCIEDIKGLKHLYKPVYGLCILFVIGVALVLGLRADTKEVSASVTVNRERHITEVGEIRGMLRENMGRYEVIEQMLYEIREDQKEILKWQREHK